MSARKSVPYLVSALVLAICAQAADEPRILTPNASSFESLSRFTELLDALQKNYAQPARIDTGPPTTAALRAFVRSLDPEADLLAPDEAPATNVSTRASAGIGLQFALCGDFPVVISPRDNSPAQSAGLLAGDQIVAIDGQPTLRARRIEVERLLRGPANSPVSLRLLDPASSAVLNVGVQRAASRSSPVVALKLLDARVAYCRIPEFTQAVVESLRAAMARARSRRAAGVVLDVRNNAGGAFEAAQIAASMFLPADATIVSLDYASPSQRTTFVSEPGWKFTAPVVVLVNAGTAAEAELFAAALQDHNRARLVGSRTFGRGFLAASITLADGSVLSVPTAYYQRPANQVFHGAGLTPDVVVDLSRETERALARAGFGAFDWANDKAEVLATDAPLAKALSLLSP